ncbi:P-loop containing nucleoside triphosphate hydrolase protein [Schizopora paradoxa]|uniref:p-loop containing nucleoside triphosphate hydrolase protein n=1 Tax=Schizopora paradoxa TaxID=27342 RepID=A0A0H2S4C0_9AGAM|nr:P-loop containing nucleoside triphosphate hydrolase protein [Schizopora paradoxa]
MVGGGAYGRKLNASEKEWLYEEELHSLDEPEEAVEEVPPRFDWRKIVQRRKQPKDIEFARSYPYVRRRRTEATDGLASTYRDSIEEYEGRFLPLIEAEEREEEKLIFDRLTYWPLERLKREGYCMTGLHAFWSGKANLGRPIAAFRFDVGTSLPTHSFSKGTKVYISRTDPLKETPYKGSIVSLTPDEVGVAFEEDFEAESGLWRMDLGYSNASFERMKAAIRMLPFDPEEFEKDARNSKKQEFMLHGTQLRDVLLKTFSPETPVEQQAHHLQDSTDPIYPSEVLEHKSKLTESFKGAFSEDMRILSWAKRYSRQDPLVLDGDPDLGKLNRSQVRAMATMIGERISLIQGPPGTGKTKTIVETVKLLKKEFGVVHPILVCTYTNVAVDNLVEGFVSQGLKPLRIGFEGKVKSDLEEHLLEYQFDSHPLQKLFEKITEKIREMNTAIRDLSAQIKKLKEESSISSKGMQERIANMERELEKKMERKQSLKVRRFIMEQRMYRDILSKVDVICTTCIRSASYQLNAIDFPVVFLDEASMCTEPASLVPLMKGCRHLALIGDHKQLPPIVLSNVAKNGGFDISLFERLTEEGVVPSIMLDTQYRMHPGISRFPSSEFYNLSLLDGTVNKAGQVTPNLLPPVSSHLPANMETGHRPSVIFIDHQGPEAVKSRSRVNWTEGYIACSVIEDLLLNNPDLRGENIGVIAPYKSQISLLTRLLTKDADMRAHLIEKLDKERAMEVANIEVKTVDGFEGREKDVIIFSTVRNNESGYIGFLADRRRLNVGLTRAKRALFVLGSMSTLGNGKFGRVRKQVGDESTKANKGAVAWRNYVEFLTEQKLIVALRGAELQKALKPLRSKQSLLY